MWYLSNEDDRDELTINKHIDDSLLELVIRFEITCNDTDKAPMLR
jgi:hypothetical protein